jgi:hypothetical protein
MWAAQAAKMGYKWKVGNGRKIRLWEDNWLGSSSLAIQFWLLYRIVNEKGKTIAELWDGVSLKCTFRRCISEDLYQSWLEVVELVGTIQFTNEADEMIWQFNSSEQFNSLELILLNPSIKSLILGVLSQFMSQQFGVLRYLQESTFSYG